MTTAAARQTASIARAIAAAGTTDPAELAAYLVTEAGVKKPRTQANRVRTPRDKINAAKRNLNALAKDVAAMGDEEDIIGLAELSKDIDALLGEVIRYQNKTTGRSWAWMGNLFGITRQAAQQRWGKAPRIDAQVIVNL